MKNMLDIIEIKGLEVFANHGVLQEENVLGQKFVISAKLYTNTRKAGQSDELTDSINYAEVAHRIRELTKEYVFQLLEALAWQIAKKLLLEYAALCEIEIKIEKPWAPIGLPIENVSVTIHRKWHDVYLGIGSNLGDKKNNLEEAIRYLSEDELTKVERISSFIVTKPVGYTEQDDFLNGALFLRTLRSPEEMLSLIHEIEGKLKRERIIHWGPRTIDLDILFYDDARIQKEDLVVPHIEMANRRFVLEPLAEIAPYLIHPVFHKTIYELLQRISKVNHEEDM